MQSSGQASNADRSDQYIILPSGTPLSTTSGNFGGSSAWPSSSRNNNTSGVHLNPRLGRDRDSAPNSQTFGQDSNYDMHASPMITTRDVDHAVLEYGQQDLQNTK